MSKESAMQALTGQTDVKVNPSLVTGDVPKSDTIVPPADTAKAPALDSDRFAALAKKEAKLQQEREVAKREREEAIKAKAEADQIIKRNQEIEALRAKDPVQAMRSMGFSETEIFNFLAENEKKDPTPEEIAKKAAKEELDAYKKEQDERAKADEEKRNQQIITRFKEDISKNVKADPEKYEFCNYHGAIAEDLIYETQIAILKAEGKVLPTAEVVEMVEKYYEEQDIAMNALKKRGRVAESKPEEAKIESAAPAKPVAPPKTLTNRVAATTAAVANKRETASEKRARLENALRNGVKP